MCMRLWKEVRRFWKQEICGWLFLHCKTKTVSDETLREIVLTTLRCRLGQGYSYKSGAVQRICAPIPYLRMGPKWQREFVIAIMKMRFQMEERPRTLRWRIKRQTEKASLWVNAYPYDNAR